VPWDWGALNCLMFSIGLFNQVGMGVGGCGYFHLLYKMPLTFSRGVLRGPIYSLTPLSAKLVR
jgi:hypothetical protein